MVRINLAELIPPIAVLLKNTLYPPHDCFTCFNKDPERRYSIFQYSKEEWKEIVYKRQPKKTRAVEANELVQKLDDTD